MIKQFASCLKANNHHKLLYSRVLGQLGNGVYEADLRTLDPGKLLGARSISENPSPTTAVTLATAVARMAEAHFH